PTPYQSRERDSVSDQVPGAIVQAEVDATHPLAFGFNGQYFSLKTSSNLFELPTNASTAIWLGANFRSIGFIGSRLKPKLQNTPIAAVQKIGEGDIVYLIDNPLFRCFWGPGKQLFANALFY
ncbi:MAG: zinc carboxypeptidase, partial [Saprospiraceae bacterium]|nr:zinc carboxypeptidase [Saprospiraceae bacterium]